MHSKSRFHSGIILTLLTLLISCAPTSSTAERTSSTENEPTSVPVATATPFPEVLQTRVPLSPSPTPTNCPLDFVNALFEHPAGLTSFRLDLDQYRLLDDLATRQNQVISSTQALIFEERLPVSGDYLLDVVEPDGRDLRLIVTQEEAYNRRPNAEWDVLLRDEGADLLRGTADSPFLPPELRDLLLTAGCDWERTTLGANSVVKLDFPSVSLPTLDSPATLTGELLGQAEQLTYTVWLGTIDRMYLPLQYELLLEGSSPAFPILLSGQMSETNFVFGVSPPPGYPLPPAEE